MKIGGGPGVRSDGEERGLVGGSFFPRHTKEGGTLEAVILSKFQGIIKTREDGYGSQEEACNPVCSVEVKEKVERWKIRRE